MKRTYEISEYASENLEKSRKLNGRTASGELTKLLESLFPKVEKRKVYSEGFGGFCTVEEVLPSMVVLKNCETNQVFKLIDVQLQYEFTNGPDSEETFKLV